MDALRVTNLCHSFASGKASIEPLRGVDLVVEKGQFVAITGPSGCGKTTLLLACGAMRKPTSGVVSIDDEDVYALTTSRRAALRSTKIGYLFQTMELLPYLSVLDNLLLVPGASKPDAEAWLSKLGLTDRTHHRSDSLSQGEMQRAAIARALMTDPTLLLADEPTGNLDTETGRDILKLLTELNGDDGLTIVMITHDDSIAADADVCYRMQDGTLEAAPPELQVA